MLTLSENEVGSWEGSFEEEGADEAFNKDASDGASDREASDKAFNLVSSDKEASDGASDMEASDEAFSKDASDRETSDKEASDSCEVGDGDGKEESDDGNEISSNSIAVSTDVAFGFGRAAL